MPTMLFPKALGLLSLLTLAHANVNQSATDDDIASINSFQQSIFGTTFGSTCACAILTGIFSDKVLYNGSTAYIAEATHYYDLREDLAPKCVFVPANANDIAKGVIALKACKSQFAIRGAGHMPVAGAANTDGGVLLALSALKNVTISDDKTTVTAGPANDWYALNSALEPYGLIVVGGRLKTIGVAGLTIGGGISYFTAKYGFAMDNVVAYDIVVSSGKVLTATATQNSDLFWALKGGSNNFGIVTSFTFTTYQVPNISTATIVYGEDAVDAFCTAAANMANYQQDVDLGAGGIYTISYTPSTGVIQPTFLGVQAGDALNPPIFENFTAIPSLYQSYNVTTLKYWSSTLDTPYQSSRSVYGTHSVVANATQLQAIYALYKDGTDAMSSVAGFSADLVFQPLPRNTFTVAKTNGIGNVWGLDDDTAYIWWLITCSWSNAADDATVLNWSKNLREEIHAANKAQGLSHEHIYYNDAADDQKPFATFPAANVARLKSIRSKYDPELVFKNLVTGGYKLD